MKTAHCSIRSTANFLTFSAIRLRATTYVTLTYNIDMSSELQHNFAYMGKPTWCEVWCVVLLAKCNDERWQTNEQPRRKRDFSVQREGLGKSTSLQSHFLGTKTFSTRNKYIVVVHCVHRSHVSTQDIRFSHYVDHFDTEEWSKLSITVLVVSTVHFAVSTIIPHPDSTSDTIHSWL